MQSIFRFVIMKERCIPHTTPIALQNPRVFSTSFTICLTRAETRRTSVICIPSLLHCRVVSSLQMSIPVHNPSLLPSVAGRVETPLGSNTIQELPVIKDDPLRTQSKQTKPSVMRSVSLIINARWVVPIIPKDTVYDFYSVIVDGNEIIDCLPTKVMLSTSLYAIGRCRQVRVRQCGGQTEPRGHARPDQHARARCHVSVQGFQR